ncbi:hypothetical protein HY312_00190 [Candidatus Saccharibacteria bacterium]|nr:hypothetical protein [Candidatus Saccharibacteria bacterium]
MIKKQEHHSNTLFKIDQAVLEADFEMLGDYGTDNLELLKKIWMDDSLEHNPSHELLTLSLRPELEDNDQIRRAYRAGVLVGTIIMRQRLQAIDADYSVVELSRTPVISIGDRGKHYEQFPTISADIKLSRFALSQFFDSTVDIAEHLKTTLEANWLHNKNTFLPEVTADAPRNDWLAVGIGDTLALYGTLYASNTGLEIPNFETKQLANEPMLHPVTSPKTKTT